ncbi:MAG TPA: hypothetical protein DDW95_14940 [Alphaproteobacteria bacterium]|jgi:uncharacterized protein (DUF983 family)|nr:hypothetical protein [Alphaproteobacteria bacterium]HAM46362.1 hypothetical protein [Alphaproteobacteria bacterium]HBA43922.1 hypothetical protein [Alphaproteobacteria bacterium]HBF99837.1 hypothetical protein [Alphaproteobacteria bacterium]HCO89680.1 hypothetical protein [Alphaproteobacteria bacterium]
MTSKQDFQNGCAPCSPSDFGSGSFVTELASPRPVWSSLYRGFRKRCPACGRGRLLHRYLKVFDRCAVCSESLHHQQADDGPPYFTMFLVGHIVIPLMLIVEKQFSPDMWVHWASWPALALLLSIGLLPSVKGALVGLQWALRMHGFSDQDPYP